MSKTKTNDQNVQFSDKELFRAYQEQKKQALEKANSKSK